MNAGARFTRKNGNSGTSRRNSRYENAFSVKPALMRSPNAPSRLRAASANTYRAAVNTSVAPIVAATTTSAVPIQRPNRNPTVSDSMSPPGRLKAVEAT